MITVPLMLLIRPHDRGRPLLDQPADAGGQVRQQVRPSRRCTSGPRLDQGREGGHQGGGDGQPPAVDRERQRDRDAEQVATQGRPEEFAARDLGGDQPPVGAVELVPADDRRQYGSGRRVAQHRGQPGAEDRDADRPDRRVTGPDQRHRTDSSTVRPRSIARTSRRRSTRSAITPAIRPNSSPGSCPSTTTPAIRTGFDVRLAVSSGNAAARIPSPRFDSAVAEWDGRAGRHGTAGERRDSAHLARRSLPRSRGRAGGDHNPSRRGDTNLQRNTSGIGFYAAGKASHCRFVPRPVGTDRLPLADQVGADTAPEAHRPAPLISCTFPADSWAAFGRAWILLRNDSARQCP